MTRFVTFNGITKFIPGGISKINAKALAPVGLAPTGIVALIGEADGGEPGVVTTVDDPSLAKSLFRSGPLADAIRVAFDPSADIDIPGGAFRVLAYKVNTVGSVQGTLNMPGDEGLLTDTAAGAPTTTVIQLTTNTSMTVNEHTGRWFQLDNTNEVRRIVSNTADTITVSPGFNAAPTGSDPVTILEDQVILTARDYGLHTNSIDVKLEDGTTTNTKIVTVSFEGVSEQSPEIVGTKYMKLKYTGGPVEDTGTVTNIDTTGLLVTVDVPSAPTLDQYAGMVLQFSDGTQRLIDGNSAADPTVVTLNAAHALNTQQKADLATDSVIVRNVTAATANMVGSAGVATSLTSAVTPTADDLSLTFNANETLRAFVDRVNSTTNYEAEIVDGINPDTTLMKDFDFGTVATSVDVRFDELISPDTTGHFRQDLKELVNWFNTNSEFVSATRATTGGSGQGSELPQDTDSATMDLGSGVDTMSLFGGARGTATNTEWQAAFDELLNYRANFVVPLISRDAVNEGLGSTATFASVAAQLKSHVQSARGSAQTERGGHLGMEGTLTAVISQASSLNDTDVQLHAQKITTLNVDGNLVEFPEWGMAVTSAGMRAGAPEVGTPLTFKNLKTTALSQDSSWSPKDLTNQNALLAGGVMYAQEAPTAGFRFVRDLTTHLLDDNIAFIDAHTRDAVRFVAYDLRTSLEERFTGVKATPANATAIRSLVAAKMAEYLNNNIIVESLDPEKPEDTTTLIPGYRRLRVSISGNVASIKVEIFPVTGIVFQLSEIFLQLPTISV